MARIKQTSGKLTCDKIRSKQLATKVTKLTVTNGEVKKRDKHRSGTENNTELLADKLSFLKLFQEIVKDLGINMRFKRSEVTAIQKATEDYFVGLLEDASLFAKHANRVTIMPKDIQLASRMMRWRFNFYLI